MIYGMKICQKGRRLGEIIATSEAILLYRPSMTKKNISPEKIPVDIYANFFKEMLEYRFTNSALTIESSDGSSNPSLKVNRVAYIAGNRDTIPPPNAYNNCDKNLLLVIDMGGLDRESLYPVMESFCEFSGCAVTSDVDFYRGKMKIRFGIIPVEDGSELLHVLFDATQFLKKKLTPLKQ